MATVYSYGADAMNTRISIVLFLAVAGLFLLTPVRNRSEAEDAYRYALQVEVESVHDLGHRHHLLYAPAMRTFLLAARSMGYEGRSMPILTAFSAWSGALSAVMVFLIGRERLGLSLAGSVLTAVLLTLSYGFWRYACEAEIYVPATALALLSVYLVTSPARGPGRIAVAGVVAGVSVSIHVLNVLPIALAGGLLLRRATWRQATAYGAIAALIVVMAYAAFAGRSFRAGEKPGGAKAEFALLRAAQPTSYARAAVGLGQSIVTGNFLFAFPAARAQMKRMFPHRVLAEEEYMGEAAPAAARVLPWVSLVGLLAAAGATAWLRLARRDRIRRGGSEPGERALCLMLALWAAAHAGLVLIFEPGNSEMWIMGLAPLALLSGYLLLDPVVRAHGILAPVLLVVFLGLHNAVGGFLLLARPEGDYHAMKARSILDRAGRGDTVLTAGNSVFVRYARYHADAGIQHLYEWPPASLARHYTQVCEEAENVFAMGDLFMAQPVLGVKFPERNAAVMEFSSAVEDEFELIEDDVFGGVYQRRVAP